MCISVIFWLRISSDRFGLWLVCGLGMEEEGRAFGAGSVEALGWLSPSVGRGV